MTYPNPTTALRTPDPILAELWEVKRQINAEAGYRLEELTRMARASAEKIRHQWQQEELTSPNPPDRTRAMGVNGLSLGTGAG